MTDLKVHIMFCFKISKYILATLLLLLLLEKLIKSNESDKVGKCQT